MSMILKCPWCPWCGHSFHIRAQSSHVSNMVTLVTCGHTCHMWSPLSNVVTLVKCGHTCHMCHTTKWETNVFNADQKASSLTDDETRPTYRPARPQVKMEKKKLRLICAGKWERGWIPVIYLSIWESVCWKSFSSQLLWPTSLIFSGFVEGIYGSA